MPGSLPEQERPTSDSTTVKVRTAAILSKHRLGNQSLVGGSESGQRSRLSSKWKTKDSPEVEMFPTEECKI